MMARAANECPKRHTMSRDGLAAARLAGTERACRLAGLAGRTGGEEARGNGRGGREGEPGGMCGRGGATGRSIDELDFFRSSPGRGREWRVSSEMARVERCTVAGVGLTVCRARDQCDSSESADPLVFGRPGPLGVGVSSEPTATRSLSGQRSTTSRSRPRSRRSAAPMTPLNSTQPSSPTPAGPIRCRHRRAAA